MTNITLTKDYGYDQYRVSKLADGTVIDASDATFIEDNNLDDDGKANPYPVAVQGGSNITLKGGTVLGHVDQTTDRETVYHFDPGNSAGVRVEDTPNVVIEDWRISNAWDGIRTSWGSDNFLIDNVWISNTRDDAIENDKLNSGTIHNSLLDGVMGGISLDPSSSDPVDGSGRSVTIDGVLMRMKTYLAQGEVTHGSPLKLDKDLPMPDLHITNSVFAIQDVHHNGEERLAVAWDNLVESHGNVFLNLSDEKLPSDYPMPPAGWTVLQGQAARDYWAQARDAWIEHHADGTAADPVPVPSEPAPEPEDPAPVPVDDSTDPVDQTTDPVDQTTDPVDQSSDPVDQAPAPDTSGDATFDGADFKGTDADDIIIGNDLDNNIDGRTGNDVINGAAGDDVIRSDDGADHLQGGAGNDTFLYKHLSDSREDRGIDTIQDFTHGADKIDLTRIDANRDLQGDQAFTIADGAAGKGQLSIHYDANSDKTVIDANVDHEASPELTILIAGQHQLTASDFIL